MYYMIFASIFLFFTPFFYFNGHNICKNKIKQKYNKWKNLNSLISTTTGKGNCKAIYFSLKIIFKMVWIMFLQYINNSVKKIDRKTSELTYVIAGKKYKMIIKPKRGPCPILQVSNENLEDLTELVIPYMGPKYDWHGEDFSPLFFNCKNLTFECANGNSFIFKNEEICKLLF